MGHRHLSEDRLIEVCTVDVPAPIEQQHLDACPSCDARRRDVEQMLLDCTTAAAADTDEAFPAERLARQHARILQRLDHDGRPGRVISFPATHGTEPSFMRARPSSRWIAVAAVAGLVIGLLAGQVVHAPYYRLLGQPPIQSAARAQVPAQSVIAVGTTMSDEEFLVRVDSALERSGGSALGPLDQLTPRVWEVAAR
jgi:hypothetical protein